MGGTGGTTATLSPTANPTAKNQLNDMTTAQNTPGVQNILSQYGQGNISLQQAIQAAQNVGQGDSAASTDQGAIDALATDPTTGTMMATQQVQSNPLLSGIFGQGGVQQQADAAYGTGQSNYAQDRQALSGNDPSYGLNEQDLAAYGQASNNIARQIGSSQNSLSESLADRGLGAAPSGSAAAQFSGLQGNQNEQLASAQQQIAQNRINTAQQLAQARTNADLQNNSSNNSLISNLGQQANTDINSQYNNNLAGIQQQQNGLMNANNQNLGYQNTEQNINNAQFQQQQSTASPSLGAALGQAAIGGLAGAVSSAPSMALGAAMPSPTAKPQTPVTGSTQPPVTGTP